MSKRREREYKSREKLEKYKTEGPSKKTFPKINLVGLNDEQKKVLREIDKNVITIITGQAGVGKTHLAVIYGLLELVRGTYKKLIFTRPCIESYGERLGSLPGDANEKISPYMTPIFDILKKYIHKDTIEQLIEEEKIITIPLAFLRGVTFNDAFVTADEFQNVIPSQMRLFLTRIGKDSKIVITGDLSQSDIQEKNGLMDAVERLRNINSIGIINMTSDAIIRNPIIKEIENRYSSNVK